MSKLFTLLAGLVLSASAFAGSPDFSAINDGGHGRDFEKCAHQAWNSTNPSDDQNTQAKAELEKIKAVYDANKEAIDAGKADAKAAWESYPVDRDQVIATEEALTAAVKPVREAHRDGMITILNLLSAEQRATFDASLKECMGSGDDDGGGIE